MCWVTVLAVAVTASAAQASALSAHGSAGQVYATGIAPRALVKLVGRRDAVVTTKRADAQGGVLFRSVARGRGYRVRAGRRRSRALTVFSARAAPPSAAVYDQTLPTSGYGYLRTRDGTRLAIDVRLPAGPGPYPTVVEYSGYGYADPAGAESGIAPIANLLGFAVVDVNMRGTGCSGGAFDYFERLQSLDGYDAVETVARQPWVLGHRVGLMGISYGGISQLFVAATDPPHLAAIAPLSVIDSTITTLYPGGILNTGFTVQWSRDRMHDARPASPTGGQPWALRRIRAGDAVCRANQALHGEAADLLAKIRANSHYVPAIADPLDPVTFVSRIHVPVYLACQFDDEQTGAQCPELVPHLTGTRRVWATFANGLHIDSLDPATFNRWYDFLQIFVAHRRPSLSPSIARAAPLVYQTAIGVSGVTLPPDPIQTGTTTYAGARAAFERLRRVRILFDNGTGGATTGAPYPGFERSFARYPIPGTRARSWYLAGGGALTPAAPRRAGADRFAWRPSARPATSFAGPDNGTVGGLWTATPTYRWDPNPPGTSVGYVTAPLSGSTVVVGGGAVRLWIKASAPSVDLQATISEVRPDGHESYVQSGWLRTDERALNRRDSTTLAPVLTLRAADVRPLPRGRFTKVTVPLYAEGHVFRRGSRIRVTISAPGGDQPVWAFAQTRPRGAARVTIAHSRAMPSRLVLPVVPGVAVPTALPPCEGLRGEPCRPYAPSVNRLVPLALKRSS